MNDFRPYMIRAIYNWLYDNDCKIHIRVNTNYDSTNVPTSHIDQDGYIVLNISDSAIGYISISENNNEYIELSMRFSGVETELKINYNAIDAIYDPMTGSGNVFERKSPEPKKSALEVENKEINKENNKEFNKKNKKKPNLRIV